MTRLVLFGAGVAVLIALAVWHFSPGARPLVLSGGVPGGTYAAFADHYGRALDAAGLGPVTVLPSAGAAENAARLATGTADIAILQADTPADPGIALLARLYPEAFHLVVRVGAGIATVGDLRGKRVGMMPEGSGSATLFDLLLQHYEIPPETVTFVRGTLTDHAAAIEAGEIDAFFVVIALGNPAIEAIIQATPTQLVPIDQAEAVALFDPALNATTVPVGTYSGNRPVPGRAIDVVSVESLLAVRRGLPDDVAERITRVLFEARQAMAREVPQAAFVAAPREEERLAFGVHPGADRYYGEDEPFFVVEYAEPLALALTAAALVGSGLWQARIWLAGRRKNRADHYNLELVAMLSEIEAATTAAEFAALRRKLAEIFERVIVDLDNDRIEERSLLSFSFAWQVAASSLNHREIVQGRGATGGTPDRPVLADLAGARP